MNKKANTSKKHHYIPRFYLKGFTDINNRYFVYDKLSGRIWQSNPDNSFYENHRNTGILKSKISDDFFQTDMAEDMLANFDNRSALALARIVKSTPTDYVLTPEVLYSIRFFIISTFWRIPANDKLRESIAANYSFKDLGFGIFDKEGHRNITLEDELKKEDLWIKLYSALLPVTAFTNRHNKLNADDWKLYYKTDSYRIVTDNPVIFENDSSFLSLHEELFCPLSNKIFIVSTKKGKPETLKPIVSTKMDLLLFQKAHRYVACADRKYLDFIKKESEEVMKNDWGNRMKTEIFNAFYLE